VRNYFQPAKIIGFFLFTQATISGFEHLVGLREHGLLKHTMPSEAKGDERFWQNL
jgi:hypothetical protein